MTKGKTTQYLKYAIGEILLVMIGILLALQVNNWNNKRIKNKKEHSILIQLKVNINAMLNDLNGDYEVLKFGMRSHLNVQEYIENNSTYDDSMCFDFHWLIKDEYIYPITSAYDQLKEEGLDLIKNDTIRDYARNIYEFALPRISKQNPFYPDLEEFFGDYYRKNFTPNRDSTLIYNYKMYNYEFKYPDKGTFEDRVYNVYLGYIPNDFEALKRSTEFKMLLQQASTYRTFKFNRYKMIIEFLKELNNYIDKELTKRYD